jgi:Type II secretion system (T2SS), protein M subtype b
VVFVGTVGSFFILFWQQRQADMLEQQGLKNRLVQITKSGSLPKPLPKKEIATFFHEGGTAEIVAAHILTDLKQVAASQAIEILRSGNRPPENKNGFTSTTVFVEISGPEAAIYKFLRQVETSRPLLMVTKLQIRGNASPDTSETFEHPLTVEMTLNGAMMPVSE